MGQTTRKHTNSTYNMWRLNKTVIKPATIALNGFIVTFRTARIMARTKTVLSARAS